MQNNQFNIDLNPLEAARRVAFALNGGLHAQRQQGELAEAEILPCNPNAWTAPADAPNMPEPVDPDRLRWAEGLALSPHERQDQALVRETREVDLETYHGSSAEQGECLTSRPAPPRKPTAAELCRHLSRRRRDELL